MRTITFIIISLLIYQQSVGQFARSNNADSVKTKQNLTIIENKLINIFLDAELKKDRYKNYIGYELFIIEESVKKTKSIKAYIYSLADWKSMNRISKRSDSQNMYFIDSLQLQKINRELEKEQVYHWKVGDFNNLKVGLYKNEELRTIINTGAYVKLPKRLIIYLSKPLIIDENNALISFTIGSGEFGNSIINHFTVLLRKENNEWYDSGYYEDGVYY